MQITSPVIPLIEYMHIYHLGFLPAIRLGLYIKHSCSAHVCRRGRNVILGSGLRLKNQNKCKKK